MEVNLSGDEKALNMIDVVPQPLKVRESQVWQQKDTSKIKDFAEVEVISDWTYSTPYNASIRFLSKN